MDKYTEKIAMYLEDALSAQEVTALEAHLANCPDCQAEQTMLKQIDNLFMNMPMVAPPPNFTARFELRLEQRINRRRTWVGASIIGLVLAVATGLLVWSVAVSGANAISLLSGFSLLGNSAGVLGSVLAAAGAFVKALYLAGMGMLQVTRHPVFWGYVVLSVGIISLWAQILRRVSYTQVKVSA